MTFDGIRATMPELRVTAYALEPGGPVTLELITPDERAYTFTRPTLAEAVAAAFPPEPEVPASILD